MKKMFFWGLMNLIYLFCATARGQTTTTITAKVIQIEYVFGSSIATQSEFCFAYVLMDDNGKKFLGYSAPNRLVTFTRNWLEMAAMIKSEIASGNSPKVKLTGLWREPVSVPDILVYPERYFHIHTLEMNGYFWRLWMWK